MRILAFGGSLRKDSFNTALLYCAKEVATPDIELEVFERLGEFPSFNQDVEPNSVPVVKELKEKVKAADAILIATPEYNYSIPGYLKNVIDWVSRPYGDNSFADKPVAIMSASGGMLGGARAQYHLRQTFIFLDMHPLNKPEFIVPFASEKIQEGKVVDEYTREKMEEFLEALVAWTERLRK